MAVRPCLVQIPVLGLHGNSRPRLKSAVDGFQAVEGVEQLHSGLPHGLAWFGELFGVSDCKFDSINRDASLICHLKLKR